MIIVTAVLTVRVLDENDNEPQFILDTLNTLRSVVEEAAANTLIGKLSNENLVYKTYIPSLIS